MGEKEEDVMGGGGRSDLEIRTSLPKRRKRRGVGLKYQGRGADLKKVVGGSSVACMPKEFVCMREVSKNQPDDWQKRQGK